MTTMTTKKNEAVTATAETKELVTPVQGQPGANLTVAHQQPFDDGLGALESSDLIIPRLVVGQAQSQIPDEAKGKFYCEVTGDAKDLIKMVVLRMDKSRVLFPEEFSRDSEPLCRSNDFVVPANDIEGATPMAVTCGECPYSSWEKNEKGKQKPPRCNECWNLLIVDLDDYTPAWFSMKSTALKPAKRVLSALKMRSAAKQVPACAFVFEATVAKRFGDSGDSYIPSFSGITELEEDDRNNMMSIRKQLSSESMPENDYKDDFMSGGSTPATSATKDDF